jgi:murein DD-endopeptidase MepM/ murein hydrolase activator NlpD
MKAAGNWRPRVAAVAASAFALLGGPAFAFDWPLAPPRIAATFGTYAKGRVVAGIALSGEDDLVRSAEDGEPSFSLEEGANPSGLPTPLGSFIVVEHQKGLAAVYSHLAPATLSTDTKFKSGDVLGKSGRSGWIEGPGILFQVFDRRSGSWVNPLLVLPQLAVDKPPVIRSLTLSHADKVYVLGETASFPQGTYAVSVDVLDPADSAWTPGPLAPYGIRLSVDGDEVANLAFDVAKGKGGRLMLSSVSPTAADELKTKDGRYNLAVRLFPRGRTTIEVRVEDAAGNKRSASWSALVE